MANRDADSSVSTVMFFAIRGNWGTHYDGPPPGFPSDKS